MLLQKWREALLRAHSLPWHEARVSVEVDRSSIARVSAHATLLLIGGVQTASPICYVCYGNEHPTSRLLAVSAGTVLSGALFCGKGIFDPLFLVFSGDHKGQRGVFRHGVHVLSVAASYGHTALRVL